MDSNATNSGHSRSLCSVVPALSLDWLQFALELYRELRKLLDHGQHEGLFEMLEYDAILELVDPEGQTAFFSKRQRVRFLQDNVIAFQDLAWGDGEVLVDYRCSPGTEVDRYQNGDRWNVLLSLREIKSSGDVEDFHIQRKIMHGFTRDEEWWQIEMQHRTQWLKLSIIFPKGRHCTRAVLTEKTRNRMMALGEELFDDLPDGRQVLTWVNKQPKRFETYTIKWTW